MIGKLFKSIWSIIDAILYFAACVSITCGAFLINKPVGFIVMGMALLLTAYFTELTPFKKGSGS